MVLWSCIYLSRYIGCHRLPCYKFIHVEYAPRVPMQPCPCTITKHRCVSVATVRRSVCGHTDGDSREHRAIGQ